MKINLKKVIITMIIIFSITNCGETKPKTKEGVFTFIKGQVQLNSAKAMVGQKVKASDKVTTLEKSSAIIQFDEKVVLAVKASTEIDIQSLTEGKEGKSVIDIAQNTGSTFSKVVKNSANYKVKTPTAVAGVRGTSFEVSISGEDTRVSLLKGAVEVTGAKTDEKLELPEGHSVDVDKNSKIQVKKLLTEPEEERLTKLDSIAFAQQNEENELQPIQVEEKAITELDKKVEIAAQPEKEPVKVEVKDPNTLVGIKRRFGTLYEVKTTAGKTIIGAVLEEGDEYVIITPKKRERIAKSKVESKEPITGPF